MEDINIGAKVNEFRTLKGMSLRELAERSGLSASMLSQIENNSVNPSINALKAISQALNVPLYKFFQENQVNDSLIVRKDEYMLIGHAGVEVQYKLLTADTSGALECCLMDIPAHMTTSDIPRGHEGEEVAFVITGNIDIELENEIFHLNEGDAIKIPPQSLHRWINETDEEVRVIFTVTPPGF